jgi:ribosomal protein S18 acetylase RimI-like enzyme
MTGDAAQRIREYDVGDASGVIACVVELQEFERAIDDRLRPGEAIAVEYLEHMQRWCGECAGTVLVAECDGEIAGFATVLTRVPYMALDDPPGEYALVSDLIVRAGFRRRGLGEALLREAERYARLAGAAELRIGVLSGNVGARALYDRAGFTPYLETLAKRLDPPDTPR